MQCRNNYWSCSKYYLSHLHAISQIFQLMLFRFYAFFHAWNISLVVFTCFSSLLYSNLIEDLKNWKQRLKQFLPVKLISDTWWSQSIKCYNAWLWLAADENSDAALRHFIMSSDQLLNSFLIWVYFLSPQVEDAHLESWNHVYTLMLMAPIAAQAVLFSHFSSNLLLPPLPSFSLQTCSLPGL